MAARESKSGCCCCCASLLLCMSHWRGGGRRNSASALQIKRELYPFSIVCRLFTLPVWGLARQGETQLVCALSLCLSSATSVLLRLKIARRILLQAAARTHFPPLACYAERECLSFVQEDHACFLQLCSPTWLNFERVDGQCSTDHGEALTPASRVDLDRDWPSFRHTHAMADCHQRQGAEHSTVDTLSCGCWALCLDNLDASLLSSNWKPLFHAAFSHVC